MKYNLTESQEMAINRIKNLETRLMDGNAKFELIQKGNGAFTVLRVETLVGSEYWIKAQYEIGKRGKVDKF